MLYKSYYFIISFLSLIIILPIIGIVSKIDFQIFYFLDFFNNKYNIKIIYISFLQAFLSALLSCFIAIPFSWSLYRNRNMKIVKFIVSLCGYSFVIPSILIIYSVVGIYGINGFLNKIINFYDILNFRSLFGLKAILIAHILLNAPFATRIFYFNLSTIPKKYIEVANSFNIGFWSNLIKIEWPVLKQNFLSVFSIIFCLCFLSFAIVMALGGGPSTSNLEVAIYQAALLELNFKKAIYLSIIQIIICIIFLLLGFYKLKGSNYFEIQKNYYDHSFIKNYSIRYMDYLLILIFSAFLFSPIFYIIINLFYEIPYIDILSKKYFLDAFKNSLILSFITAILVTIIGLIISILLVNLRKNTFLQQNLFIMSSIILIISPIIISLGYFIILGELRYELWVKYIVIIIINSLFLIPFSILILFTNLKNVFLNFEDTKKTFRIDDMAFIKIIFPLIKNNLFYVFNSIGNNNIS